MYTFVRRLVSKIEATDFWSFQFEETTDLFLRVILFGSNNWRTSIVPIHFSKETANESGLWNFSDVEPLNG